PDALAARMSGAADWTARILSGRDATQLTVASDLVGLGIGLPAPFEKPASESRPVVFTIANLGGPDEVTRVQLAGAVEGRFARTAVDGVDRWNAALAFGVPVERAPPREGVWLYGALPALDVDAWQALFPPAGTGTAAPAAGANVAGD